MKSLSAASARQWLQKLPDWKLASNHEGIFRTFRMHDFLAAIAFMRRIAEAAEGMDHHPDLHLTGYRKLKVFLSTHSVHGLSQKDFVLAGKIEALPKKLKT